jgi:hypothetical protein
MLLSDYSFTASGAVTISGDFYLYGYVQDSGYISGAGTTGVSLGTVQQTVATITVNVQIINAATNAVVATFQDQTFSAASCNAQGGSVDYNCVNITKINSDYSFSHSVNLPTSGTYYVAIDTKGDAYSEASGYADAETWACLSTLSTICYTPGNYNYVGSTTCPLGISENPCYYLQWKYTTYTADPQAFSLSASPNPIGVDCVTGATNTCYTVAYGTTSQIPGSTVSLTGNSGSGTVSMSAQAPTSGWTLRWQYVSVSLTQGQQVKDLLTITAPYNLPSGWYYVSVTGISGPNAQTITISVNYGYASGGSGCGGCHTT